MRHVRRVLRVVLVLLLLAVAGIAIFALTLPRDDVSATEAGELRVLDAARGTWEVGPLVVTVDAEGLEIADAGRTVWASVAGSAFVSGASGAVSTEEHRGYFWPDVRHEEQWTDQQVDSVEASGSAITLAGTLGDGMGTGDAARDEYLGRVAWRAVVTPRDAGGARLEVEVDGVDAVTITTGRSGSAGVHGLGEQFDDFDLDGRLVPILVREQGVGRGEQPLSVLADLTNRSAAGTASSTYAAWASFVTDDLRGVALAADRPESHAFAVADTRDQDAVGLEVWAPRVTLELTSGDTPAELLEQRHTGAPTLPTWTQDGVIVGLQGGTDVVRRRVADLQGDGVEVAAVWLQDWTGQRTTSFGDRLWWTWQLDEARYPGWDQLVEDLAAEDIEVTTYVNPFLVDAAAKGDAGIRNLYDEAAAQGYLVRRAGGGPYLLDQGGFDAALVDLTNPAARDWFAGVIAEEVLGAGSQGFMADFAEGLPFDAVLHDGDAEALHNAWPGLWAETVRQACEAAGQADCLTWFRSGSLGMGEDASLFWNGDQMVDFSEEDGLASVLRGTFSAGVSGWPLVHSDLGGYTSIDAVVKDYVRTPELLQRWAELAAFGVVMRTHEGNRPGSNPQVHDDGRRDELAPMTRAFAALAPYREEVLLEATERGLPAVRHGWLAAPGTPAAQVDSQFFLGDSLLVAPVLEAGVDEVAVTFPPGEWVHLFTGESFTEGTREVSAPLGRPAAFIAAGHPLAGQLVAELRD